MGESNQETAEVVESSRKDGPGWKGDVFGGLTAAVIALPLAIAFGVSAFVPFGPEHASTGALVGLLGAIYTGFFAALFGGTPVQITGPTAPMTVVVTAFLADAVQRHGMEAIGGIMVMMAIAIVLGGVFQFIVGVVGGGKIIKYIPYPVVAGFMNGIAVLIFLSQLRPFLGVQGAWSELTVESAWVPVAVGSITIVATITTKRLTKSIPASLVGLICGITAYLILGAVGHAPLSSVSNPLLLGPIPNPFTDTETLAGLLPFLHLDFLGMVGGADVRSVITTALTLGVLGCIDSLLTSVVADAVTHSRHDSKRELMGQGIGNVVSGVLGGLAGAGATVRTLVNIDAGGRTNRSGMLHAVVIFLVVLLLGQPAGWIPMAALAGLLFVTAYGIVDFYSLRLVRRRRVRHEFAIMVVVTVITVVVDLMAAVAVGCGIAAVLFIWQQTKVDVARRKLRGDQLMSRRLRGERERAVLEEHGGRTLAYELTGSLFFGTSDTLIGQVEDDLESADRFIFDFAKVRDMDLSGVQILLTIVERLKDAGRTVAFSGMGNVERANEGLHKLLVEMEILTLVDEQHVHETLDRALEAFEQELLDAHLDERAPLKSRGPLALADFEGFDHLDEKELEQIEELIVERSLVAGDVLFHDGDAADQLALVREGRFDVFRTTESGTPTRLACVGRGSVWGARSFFDGARWTSTVRAATDAQVYLLPREAISTLAEKHPLTLADLERELLRIHLRRIEQLTNELVLLEES